MADIDLHFPFAGTDVSRAFCKQPNRPVQGKYSRTTPLGRNVRAFDSLGRMRGGIRPGLVKYLSTRPGNVAYITQSLSMLVVTGASPVQSSQSGRDVRLIAISQGNGYYVSAGGAAWNTIANTTASTPPLNITGLMQSAVNNQRLYFADGTNWVYYDPLVGANGSMVTWTATSGTLPVGSDGGKPRIICTWRGRTMLSGLVKDPCNIFASKVSDPHNFDYAPPNPVPADAAFALNVSTLGKTGTPVNCLIPYTDDILIVGMESKIALMRGDPSAGGQIDIVTESIGILWGQAWAMDPTGVVYFFSNLTGIFMFVPGNQPMRMSQAIDPLLKDIDTGLYNVLLQWNDRYQQLHVWVTLLSTVMATTHYVWEQRAKAWWTDSFRSTNLNPLCCVSFDGNEADDRMALIGTWVGFVQSVSSDATTDDGDDIESEVWIGPFLSRFDDVVLLREIQGVLGETSGDVNYEIFVSDTPEAALSSTAVASGTWSAGSNFNDTVMRAGKGAYVRLSSAVPWALENIRTVVDPQGKIRQRGKG